MARGTKRKRDAVEALPPDEAARRKRQRDQQAKALKLRTEGKTYGQPKKRKAAAGETGSAGGGGVQGVKAKKEGGRRGKKPAAGPLQVILVPIFWNKRPEEKAAVLRASEAAVKLLKEGGVACGLDASDVLNPGQKFKHWEERGVRLRVELGPRDAGTGQCVLARCLGKPGEVAQKSTVTVATQLLGAVKAALEANPTPQAKEAAEEEPTDGEGPEEKKRKKGEKAPQVDEQGHGQPTGDAVSSPEGASAGSSRTKRKKLEEGKVKGKKGKQKPGEGTTKEPQRGVHSPKEPAVSEEGVYEGVKAVGEGQKEVKAKKRKQKGSDILGELSPSKKASKSGLVGGSGEVPIEEEVRQKLQVEEKPLQRVVKPSSLPGGDDLDDGLAIEDVIESEGEGRKKKGKKKRKEGPGEELPVWESEPGMKAKMGIKAKVVVF